MKETINNLKNVVLNKRFVNCCTREFSLEDRQVLEQFLLKLKEGYENIYVDVDIQAFEKCKDEEDEANVLLELINRGLTGNGIDSVDLKGISIANALHKFGNNLDRQVLLVFHCFQDPYSEKEKNILRSLRKVIRDEEEISSYLRLLIVSNRKVTKWSLFPESNLDERHVAFFEVDST